MIQARNRVEPIARHDRLPWFCARLCTRASGEGQRTLADAAKTERKFPSAVTRWHQESRNHPLDVKQKTLNRKLSEPPLEPEHQDGHKGGTGGSCPSKSRSGVPLLTGENYSPWPSLSAEIQKILFHGTMHPGCLQDVDLSIEATG